MTEIKSEKLGGDLVKSHTCNKIFFSKVLFLDVRLFRAEGRMSVYIEDL